MKKLSKKLKLAKETLHSLETGFLENVVGAETERSLCVTNCGSRCTICPNTACALC